MPFILLPGSEVCNSTRYGLGFVAKCMEELSSLGGNRQDGIMTQLTSVLHGEFADGESIASIEPRKSVSEGRGPRSIVDFLAGEVFLDPTKEDSTLMAYDYVSGTSYLIIPLKDIPEFNKSQRLILWRHGCLFSKDDIMTVKILLEYVKARLLNRLASPPISKAVQATCRVDASELQSLSSTAAMILNGMPGIAMLCDATGNIMAFNKEAEEKFGGLGDRTCPILESGSTLFSQACHPDDVINFYKSWGEAARKNMAEEITCRLLFTDEKHHSCQCRIAPLNKDAGPPRDMPRLVMVREIPDSSPELSPENAASKAKSRFLAEIAHEIRTPLSCVLGTATLLSLTKLDPDQEELLKTITIASQQLSNLVSNVLDLGKIEENKMVVEKGPVHLEKCFSETMELFRTEFASSKLEPIIDIAPRVPSWIASDELRLKQIVTNLLSNAIKFSPPRAVIILAVSILFKENMKNLQISIEDEGIGISEEAGKRLFQSYNQLEPSTTRKYGGTGLGLVISKRLVELLGGSIGYRSTPGKGSVFYFVVPCQEPTGMQISLLNPRVSFESLESQIIGIQQLLQQHGEASRVTLNIEMSHAKVSAHYNCLFRRVSGITVIDSEDGGFLPESNPCLEILISDLEEQLESASTPNKALVYISYDQVVPRSRYGLVEHVRKPAKDHQVLEAVHHLVARTCKDITVLSPKSLVRQETAALCKDFASLYPLRILIAEDDELNQKLLVKILARLGYKQIDVANDGEQVLRLVGSKPKEQEIDVIFMDTQMPVLDGCGASLEIRQLTESGAKVVEHGPHIVAMTANAFQEDRQSCLRSGMCRFASKPVNLEFLVRLLKEGYEALQGVRPCRCQSPSASSW